MTYAKSNHTRPAGRAATLRPIARGAARSAHRCGGAIALIVTLALAVLTPRAAAQTIWHVPADLPTIQQAINAAVDGDEIIVAPGTYNETINLLGKAIHLRSSDGPEVTMIDAQGNGSVVTCNSGEGPDTVIEGFTITDGTGTTHRLQFPIIAGGGVFVVDSSPTIIGCVILQNHATPFGGGLYVENGSPSIIETTFLNNTVSDVWSAKGNYFFATSFGAGAYIAADSAVTFTDCEFIGNKSQWQMAGSFAGAIAIAQDAPVDVANTLFCANEQEFGDDIDGPWNDLGGNQFLDFCPTAPPTPPDPVIVEVLRNEVIIGWPDGAEPPPGVTWYWQGTSCDETQELGSGPQFLVTRSGEYYIRAFAPDSGFWSPSCGSILVTEAWADLINVPGDADTIQQAIELVAHGGEIVVAPGNYNEAIDFLDKSIHLRSSDGPDVTFIDGTGLGERIVTISGGQGPETVLEGFTIRNSTGGGLLISHASPTIENCGFVNNSANSGGAVLIEVGSPVIANSSFIQNVSGAVHITNWEDPDEQNHATLINCSFRQNSSGSNGGAIRVVGYSGAIIADTLFLLNSAEFDGGAIYLSRYEADEVTILDSTFISNSSGFDGGAIVDRSENSPLTISGCTFTTNSGMDGGAVADWSFHWDVVGTALTVANCTFDGNEASGDGGAIAFWSDDREINVSESFFQENVAGFDGGAVADWGGGNILTFIDCTFAGNVAGSHGGAYADFTATDDEVTFQGCNFTDNGADIGGAVRAGDAPINFIECLFDSNEATSEGGALRSAMFGGARILLRDNHFAGNTAPVAPGVVAGSDEPAVTVRGQGVIGDHFINETYLHIGIDGPAAASVAGDYVQVGSADGSVTGFMTGNLFMKVGGLSPGEGHDVLNVDGVADLGGMLNVSLIDDFTPSPGNAFTIVTAASIEGVFSVAMLPKMPLGLFMQVQYSEGGGAGGGAGGASVILTVEELGFLLGFGDPAMFGIEGAPTAVAVADFDGENGDDIALTLAGDPGHVLVLYNDGTGLFSGQQFPVQSQPSAITTADFNNNGLIDIAVTNAGSNTVSVLNNTGTSFAPGQVHNVGVAPSAIVAGDFRNIGSYDLAIANAGDDTVHILRNINGTFAFASSTDDHDTPVSLALGDLNHSGFVDLVVANFGDGNADNPGSVQTLFNNGSGGFGSGDTMFGGTGPQLVMVEDFDNTKDKDIAVASHGTQTLGILLNQGGGSFAPAVLLPMNGEPGHATAFDMDGDGDIDVAIVVNDPVDGPIVRILRNDTPTPGQVVFSHVDDIAQNQGATLVAHGDVTNDGVDDLITIGAATEGGTASGDSASVAIHPNMSGTPQPNLCPGDLTGSGSVGVPDLLQLLSCWGPVAPGSGCEDADLMGGGSIGVPDLLDLLSQWGPCP